MVISEPLFSMGPIWPWGIKSGMLDAAFGFARTWRSYSSPLEWGSPVPLNSITEEAR